MAAAAERRRNRKDIFRDSYIAIAAKEKGETDGDDGDQIPISNSGEGLLRRDPPKSRSFAGMLVPY